MNLITSTELRTKTNELVELLLNGEEVKLVHRSKIIAIVKPTKKSEIGFDANTFMKITAKINHPILTDEEIDKRYREAMIKKHGKHLRRH